MSLRVVVEEVGEGSEDDFVLEDGVEIIDLIERLGRNPEGIVVKRNDKIVSEKENLEDGDSIVIVPIVSGG